MRTPPTPYLAGPRGEWLEADGLGGFASGSASGIRTRRYHGLLVPALQPPSGRVVLVSDFEADVETVRGRIPLSAQHYQPGVTVPGEAVESIVSFDAHPWPTWLLRLRDGKLVRQEIYAEHGTGRVVLAWRIEEGRGSALLRVRPLIAARDYHGVQRENASQRHDARIDEERVEWRPYDGLPPIHALANAAYTGAPEWYRSFLYTEERERGLDDTEDLAIPGEFTFDLAAEPAYLVLHVGGGAAELPTRGAGKLAQGIREREFNRRAAFPSVLHRAADQYLVRRGGGHTVIAGYPWFTDWGRDTFIALRGLCLAAGRVDVALAILSEWAGHVSEGMLPNRFPDGGDAPEFNSVDASLWYIVAASETLERAGAAAHAPVAARIREACLDIAEGYRRGTRHQIAMDPSDGLVRCGERGVQLTWMDAKVGDWVVTPRIGKPVEIQALWINALAVVSGWDSSFRPDFDRAMASFEPTFWNGERGCLFDVADDQHRAGAKDGRLRPNQIFAAGGLPVVPLSEERAAAVVDVVERALWTPMGLRSLAPGEPGYATHYRGGVWERDGAYHQGTVWPWLAGAFVEAWVRARGATGAAKAEAAERFLAPLERNLSVGSHLAEIADAEPPHTPRGCPFQAWSVGELLRLRHSVLSPAPGEAGR
ncbi:MAG: amylo-alpha-1,6-glucosidase [Candidatus Sumerlaeia bacterium]|nr:amylo-alpha-1,6-glucosidase [Candidatus Sumerlaeia bacterium]